MSPEEFQREAERAFINGRSDVGIYTSIDLARCRPGRRYRVVVSTETQTNHGTADTPEEAIMNCRNNIMQDNADRIEAARKLLGIS